MVKSAEQGHIITFAVRALEAVTETSEQVDEAGRHTNALRVVADTCFESIPPYP